jgi:hypothetical protein
MTKTTKTKKSAATSSRRGPFGMASAIAERFWGPAWKFLLVLWVLRTLVRLLTRRRAQAKPGTSARG